VTAKCQQIVGQTSDVVPLSPPCSPRSFLTREMGVELRMRQRIELTISSSPDRHTLVTRARSGPRCRPGKGLDSAEVTTADTRPSVCSLTSRHRLRRLSTFWAWTGSLWVGVPSAVPSGWVHRAFAPGLAHMMSSGSGPCRLEEKGTLKERLTCVPGAITGGADVAVEGRLIGAETGISWFDLENEKLVDGAIFSQPCRAWAGKFESLCMVVDEYAQGVWRAGRWVEGEEEETRKIGEVQASSCRASERACERRASPQPGLPLARRRVWWVQTSARPDSHC